jgi:uncharacterized protein YidB (DUF937 family)
MSVAVIDAGNLFRRPSLFCRSRESWTAVVAECGSGSGIASDKMHNAIPRRSTVAGVPMSLFESLVKAGSGAVELLRTRDSSASGILAVVQGLAQDHGGLSGLLAKFNEAGLAEQVKSWIGTGSNLPLSAQHVIEVLGQGRLGEIAQQLGMDPQQAANQLAQHLPQIVDHLSPNGELPGNDVIAATLRSLQGRAAG